MSRGALFGVATGRDCRRHSDASPGRDGARSACERSRKAPHGWRRRQSAQYSEPSYALGQRETVHRADPSRRESALSARERQDRVHRPVVRCHRRSARYRRGRARVRRPCARDHTRCNGELVPNYHCSREGIATGTPPWPSLVGVRDWLAGGVSPRPTTGHGPTPVAAAVQRSSDSTVAIGRRQALSAMSMAAGSPRARRRTARGRDHDNDPVVRGSASLPLGDG